MSIGQCWQDAEQDRRAWQRGEACGLWHVLLGEVVIGRECLGGGRARCGDADQSLPQFRLTRCEW